MHLHQFLKFVRLDSDEIDTETYEPKRAYYLYKFYSMRTLNNYYIQNYDKNN